EGAGHFRIERLGRLLLHEVVEHFVVGVIIRRYRVHGHACSFHELWCLGLRDLTERRLTREETCNCGAIAAGNIGIDLEVLFDGGNRWGGVVVRQERTAQEQNSRCSRASYEVTI